MKRILLIFAFVALSYAAQSQNYVYVVSYDSAMIIVAKKYRTIEDVKKLFNSKVKELESGNLIDFCIVKMRETKNGKLKRVKR